MRVLFVTNQRPLPTFHGTNADHWRLIRALQLAGVDVAIVSYRDGLADDTYLEELRRVVPKYIEFPIDTARVLGAREARRVPDFVSRRRISAEDVDFAVAWSRRFEPDVVMQMGLYCGELAIRIAHELRRPLVYRSSAIETLYYREYFRLLRAGTERSRRSHAEAVQMRAISRFEQLVVSCAGLTLEVSADDLDWRQRSPRLPIAHFPPLVPTASADAPERTDNWDVCYVGNFFMPNNQEGIRWFVTEVLPRVLAVCGPLRVVIAGKATDFGFVRSISKHGVEVIPNPADADEIIAGSAVGVNPIFAGNGTTLKTIDYLWSGCAVVTTPIGLQGYRFGDPSLPITVAGSASAFADAITARLGDRHSLPEIRSRLHRFTWEAGGPRLAEILASV
jgi:hypothetical protein